MKLSKKSGLSFFELALIITAMTLVLINNSNTNLAYSGLSTDPRNIPVPEFDFDDPARAMVVTVFFNSESDVIFESAHVSSRGAPAHIGNPPILMIQTFDVDGVLMGEFNSWHPLSIEAENVDGTLSSITLDSGPGTFIVPFEPKLDSLMIVDVEQNEELIFVELAAPIRAFCQDNPDHPNCIDAIPPVVGGELIPIETTSLLLAGAQTFSWMIPIVLSVLGIGLFVVSRKSENS